MELRPLMDRVAAISALDDPIRRELFDYVSRRDAPVSRNEAAQALGLTRQTAVFHLDRLVDDGLLTVQFKRLNGRTGPGAGRPSKLYTRTTEEVAVTVPERRYDFAALLLLTAIEESTRTGGPATETLLRVARETGRALGADAGSLERVLEDHGYEPRPDADGAITLGNCPFHRLARQHTDTVCHLNLELLCGAAEGSNDDRHTLVLDPGTGRCCVRALRRQP
ncbi:helix-turn-helix transcriptional regulator [Jiangella muralis]|uniref:helix-turn-helix transcriptional regulator n=1 Tax=Jiangella muralis TaxID=702383 RepID=UPI000AE7D629|nr:helix-turn-helix domain-containing protein [Jiangella muralis]